jgi:hypothetical protein
MVAEGVPMPFFTAEGQPLDRVSLLYRVPYRNGREFQLERGFVWVDPRDGAQVPVPAHDVSRPPLPHNGTDLASVPPFLWGLVASYGHQTLPAILHDSQSDAADLLPADERLGARRIADDRFRVALRESGVTTLRATSMWAFVSINRYFAHALGRAILLTAQVALGAVVIVAAVVLAILGHPLWLLLLVVPLVFAVPWWRNAEVVIAATYLGALYSPLVVAAALSSAVEYLTALIVWAGGGFRGATPRPGPTLRREV